MILACAASACAQGPTDVPRDHWAYEAVNELISKGYMIGYPDGSFLGNRNLTRYEFAVVIARLLSDLNSRVAASAQPSTTAQPAQPGVTPASPSVPPVGREDAEKLARLVEEFKPELVVIGTRLDRVEAELAALRDKVGTVDVVEADVRKLKKIGLSGYVQGRYQTIDPNDYTTSEDNYKDTFVVRRARIKVTAAPTTRSLAVLQLELAKNSVGVKDAYFGYRFAGTPTAGETFYIGQMNWPFGYEVPLSSSVREVPERALFLRRFFPGERDQGAVIHGAMRSNFLWQFGVFNGTGTEKGSSTDKNDHKDIILNLKKGLGHLDIGVSYYGGQGVWQAFGGNFLSYVPKSRYGANLQYHLDRLAVKAEWARGRGVDEAAAGWDQSDFVNGYYAQVAFSITQADNLVVRYSSMEQDPVKPQYGRVSSWDLGYVRWLDANSRFKLFYIINNEELNSISGNNGWVGEWIVKY